MLRGLTLYDILQGRRAEQEWVKVPSHLDLEGNEKTDKLAAEGVKKHGVKLAAEGKKKDCGKEARATKEPTRTAGEKTKNGNRSTPA